MITLKLLAELRKMVMRNRQIVTWPHNGGVTDMPSVYPSLRQQAASALACFVLTVSGCLLVPSYQHVGVLAPGMGLALALALWHGARVLPALGSGVVLAHLLMASRMALPIHESVLLALGLGVAAVMHAGLAAALVRRSVGDRWRTLDLERDIFLLMLLAGPLTSLLSSMMAVAILRVLGVAEVADLPFLFWHRWLGDTLGTLVFTPLVLMLLNWRNPAWHGRRSTVLSAILLMLLVLVPALHAATRWENRQLRDKVEHYGDDIATLLQQRFHALDESLAALRRLVEVTPEMSFRQFEYFTRITLQDNKEIAALSFSSHVPQAARRDFERRQAERLGLKEFQITEHDAARKLIRAGLRSEYVPIGFIAPLEGNRPAVGYDINSEAVRHDAVERARQNGAPAATGVIQLVQDQRGRTGILVLHPAYRQVFYMAEQPESRELIGFASAVVKVEEMVQIATWNLMPAGMLFSLHDSAEAEQTLIFASAGDRQQPDAGFAWQTDLKLADRTWRLSVFPTEPYVREQRVWAAFGIGLASMFFIAVLQILLLAATGRTAAVQRRIEQQKTELRVKGEALEQVLDEHDSLVRRIPVGVYKMRMGRGGDIRFEYVSPRWCEQLGLTPEAVIADPQLALRQVHPDEFAEFMRSQREAFEQLLPYEWEGRFLRGGEVRWLHLQSTPTRLENGDVVWDGVQTDITDKKLTEGERRLLSQAIAQSNASIVITNAAGDIAFVNDAFVATTGYQREEVIGVNPRVLQSGSTKLETYQALWRTITRGETWRGELQNKKKDGELYWEFATISPVLDDKGRVTHFIAIKENISDRKRQESEIQQAKEDAEAANLAKSQFLATMSHEIRTPMNGILGMAQLLLMGGLTDEQRDEYVRIILNSGNTLQSLLNDILDLSKVEAGKLELHPTVFDPRQILDETAALFSGPAQQKGLRMDAAWHGPAARCYQADVLRIRQMLSNLLSNAIKFTTAGYVRIDGAEIQVEGEEALLSFSVTDSGLGVAADRLDLLFKPFSQVDASSTRQFGGTGLGLSIVRRLAELMGGSVGVDSQPGQGSRFWFRIRVRWTEEAARPSSVIAVPVVTEAPIMSPQSGQTLPVTRAPVLVVEDNVTNRVVIEALLRKQGFASVSAENGQEAVAMVQSGLRPWLVFMDCQMPVMDGYEATGRIRQWEKETGHSRLPILALTAGAFEADRQRALDAGMDDFLTKPVSMDKLTAVLNQWVAASTGGHEAQVALAEIGQVGQDG